MMVVVMVMKKHDDCGGGDDDDDDDDWSFQSFSTSSRSLAIVVPCSDGFRGGFAFSLHFGQSSGGGRAEGIRPHRSSQ